jgi:hypothetical protein
MPPQSSFLHKQLQVQPSAPESDFDKFIVGQLPTARVQLLNSLRSLISCTEPSRLQLILGPNGNGKTLLNNVLKEEAAKQNRKVGEGSEPRLVFNVLFSRITLNTVRQSQLGIELAKGLQRSLREAPNITYSSIATDILKRFMEDYKPPFHIRLAGVVPKYFLKKAIRRYDELLRGLLTTDEVDPIAAALDTTYARIQRELASNSVRKSFARYVDQRQISAFLRPFLGEESQLSIRQLNEALYDDLIKNQSTGQPIDTVRALASIGRDVGCRLLLLMIDDCNLREPPNSLLSIVEHLGEFKEPKLFLVVSAIEEVWKRFATSDSFDLSAKQKLELFGNPIILQPPSHDELNQLFDKLVGLMNAELSDIGKRVDVARVDRQSMLEGCKGLSYREATKRIVDHLEKQSIV